MSLHTVWVETFDEWRDQARSLVLSKIEPHRVVWGEEHQSLLFQAGPPLQTAQGTFSVPKEFVAVAKRVALHRNQERWALLYRVLWRLQTESRRLLDVRTDADVSKLYALEGEVRRDCHKMKAFVRFRKTEDDRYVAWHQPSHLITEVVAPFFARRFDSMTWAILTPDRCAYWDQKKLSFGPGLSRAHAPDGDELEELWKTYYANIFNPARIKISAMTGEMPKKYWHTMPETALIQELLAAAPERVEEMVRRSQRQPQTPADSVDQLLKEGGDLARLRDLALRCQGCELCHSATQTVFGVGPPSARVMLVGEQPGDSEDQAGMPFVGPAGRLLRQTLQEIGQDPEQTYMTNVVKHFRWVRSPGGGKRRLHKRATWRQIDACLPFVRAEIALVRPQVVVLLGATALQALVGRERRIGADRGRPLESDLAPTVIATVHPSSLLRMSDLERRESELQRFHQDLGLAFSRAS